MAANHMNVRIDERKLIHIDVTYDCEWLGYPYLRQSDTWTAHRDEILDTLEVA